MDEKIDFGVYVTKSGIKKRGWTDKTIKLFLPVHNKEVKNPYYRRSSDMKLYLISNIENIESRPDFKEFQKSNVSKRESARKAVETKREKLLRQVTNWNIDLKRKDYDSIVQDAINSYNGHKHFITSQRNYEDFDNDFEFDTASMSSDVSFLKRITVNFLRHKFSNYDEQLEMLFRKIGKHDAYKILNQKIYEKISEVYPELKSECESQMFIKFDGDNDNIDGPILEIPKNFAQKTDVYA